MNATLLGQAIAFTLFVWFCMKYVWPPIMEAIEERQKKIADGLSAAERAAKDLDLAQANASDQLKEAKRAATEIIEQANKRKSQILDEAREEALVERQKILTQGEAELESERNRARDELRKQVATLAVIGAEKILERSIDVEAQKDILDNITAKL
ncbi:F0F1 ATP synthase subunit B [Aliivibrio fischeri]|uniref:ATP synthase subunit b n=4 Tax=Aliivibrio fischeri TaxID=668 RepID=ATPF_ALIF1|nr:MULTISPECIES: F0F1 ATP synthase subunit B [Aliivibrio]B5FCZ5.1 RecName: Full=ATP synthase subunit b; AltName: Full=ATP synthase F(0) sector subunit b; AltName: Full=ATPase subunit I; AltName: Full=F-type ATPase subunit b; Short=F-ATPase subunit b [Aliivibrio fischeri MJ11]Q5E1N3.1 RecName: Full=ATP synthase subunit b; AltName: Full=ATP synthase F(0) sector subunit b; AltName: Full=ATPase subunit I; AltName: Full=F-type ATPase subunit b; Short=F-ATPase subunit b [Aliivibrio fischeri ES114]AAW8